MSRAIRGDPAKGKAVVEKAKEMEAACVGNSLRNCNGKQLRDTERSLSHALTEVRYLIPVRNTQRTMKRGPDRVKCDGAER
jgi:hypothetical protein